MEDENQRVIEFLTCPECGKHYKSLLGHMKTHGIIDGNEFREKYPDYNGPLHLDVRKRSRHVCPECGKEYTLKNCLYAHIRLEHPVLYEIEHSSEHSSGKRKCANLICPICNRNFSDIKQHINFNHRMDWMEFCNIYGWDEKLTKCVTDEYRRHLSENKKKFYDSDRGSKLKEIQSEKWSKYNPSKDRNTISKSIYNRTMNGRIPELNFRGINVRYCDTTFRSLNEFTFYILCLRMGMTPEYENTEYTVRYLNEKKKFITTYLPDFYIDGIGLIELKSSKIDKSVSIREQSEKFSKVSKIYNSKKIPFHILYLSEALDIIGCKMRQYEIDEYVKKFILENIDSIHIWCKPNSQKIQKIFGGNICENKHITITKTQRK